MDIADLVGKGLPAFAVEEMAARGITTLEPLQRQAVEGGLFDGRNMVVMAPTSCGKTLVAELAALYTMLFIVKELLSLPLLKRSLARSI